MGTSAADPSVRGKRIGLSLESGANLFFRDLTEAVRAAADEQGVEVLTREYDTAAEHQCDDIAELLDAGVEALIISPVSTAVAGALTAAEARGVPVITVDRAVEGAVVAHVTSDNRLGGRLAAGLLSDMLPAGGEVAIIGQPPGTSTLERIEGFTEALTEHAHLRMVARIDAAYDHARAHGATVEALRAHPQLRGIFATNDVTVQGVLVALRDVGRDGDVIVVGYDATPQGCEEIMRGGPLCGEVAQFPARIGRTAVELWVAHLRGEEAPRRVEVPVELVTRENVERFTGAERLLRVRRGEVWTAEERVVFFPVRGYQMMLNEIHRASPDLLRHIVYRSGFVLGQSIAEQVRELYPDPHDRLFVLLEDLSRGGYGAFELLELDLDGGGAQIRGRDLFEASIAGGLDWARTPRCVDVYCSGRLAGYLTAIFGRTTACEEVLCQARGDDRCLFALSAETPDPVRPPGEATR